MSKGFPDVFAAMRERLEADMARLLGLPLVELVPLSYDDRPYSHLLRAVVRGPDAPTVLSRLFIKQLKAKADKDAGAMRARVVHEFTTSRRVHDALEQFPDLGAVRPLLHYPEALTIVTEEVRGETLFEYLQQRATGFPNRADVSDMERTLATAGRWIAALQAIDERSDGVALEELRAYMDVRLARLVAEPRTGFRQDARSAVLRHVDRLSTQVPSSDLRQVLVHADLAVGNVMVDDGRIVVLDFAMAHAGTRLHDITRLHLQLDLLCAKPQFRRAVVSRLQRALHRGFDPTLTDTNPLFRLLVLLHRVNNLATLSLRPQPFPASLYGAHVRRLHRRAIARELRSPVEGPTRVA